jgi:hypothetical protein
MDRPYAQRECGHRMRRHPFDPFSFLFGALFVSVGLSFVAGSTIAEAWRSIWPMVAIVVGITLAAWAAVSAVHQWQPPPAEIATTDGGGVVNTAEHAEVGSADRDDEGAGTAG